MSDEPRVLGGRYQVGELIGRGGMAEVHLGHDLRLSRPVAIKILRTDLARDTSFLARFRREAQAAAGLNHPAVVAVYDSGEQAVNESGGAPVQVPYIVMEHVDGKTLREVLNDEKVLDPDEAARITAAVLGALEYSHDRGIVHRDIKPANVMITRGGAVKVMDFGIARALADTAATMTQTQAVLGTARYLSPEQAQGQDVDTRSDLYSAGCLLYELLTGRTPFVGDPVSLVYQHLGEQPKPPSTLQPDVPQSYDAVTLHALEKPREARYQSAATFREDLAAARAGRPVSRAAAASLHRALSAGGATGSGEATEQVPVTGRPGGPQPDDTGGQPAAGIVPGLAPQEPDDFEDTDEIPVREERHRGGWIVLSVLALLALAAVSWVVYQSLGGDDPEPPTEVQVPQVLEMQQEDAEDLLESWNLEAQVSTASDNAPAGTVIAQDPSANTTVVEGSIVQLTVSAGPDAIELEDLAGTDATSARNRLQGLNLEVADEDVEEIDVSRDPGVVVRTDPEAGSAVMPGETVITLYVSSENTEVPDVVGEDESEAREMLADADLVVRVEREESDEEPGTVLSQSQEPETELRRGSPIELVIAIPRTVTETQSITVTITPPPTAEPTDDPTATDPPDDDPSPTRAPPTDTGPTTGEPPGDDED